MISRIKGREKTKQDLQVCLGEAMLHLGGEVRLGKALLLPRRIRQLEIHASGLPRQALFRLGDVVLCRKQKWEKTMRGL